MNNQTLKNIKKTALDNVNKTVNDVDSLHIYLKRWWCWYYKRPYKDSLLGEYTYEELLLEYWESIFLNDEESRMQAEVDFQAVSEEDKEDYEDWLKEEMGDDYQSPLEMQDAFDKTDKTEEVKNAKA